MNTITETLVQNVTVGQTVRIQGGNYVVTAATADDREVCLILEGVRDEQWFLLDTTMFVI